MAAAVLSAAERLALAREVFRTTRSPTMVADVSRPDPLVQLGRALQAADYQFVTVTPETHRRVLARSATASPTHSLPLRGLLRDIFGWNRVFSSSDLPPAMLAWLREADACEQVGEQWRARIRFATLGDRLFVHSGYPTTASDAVFFGPDTYRFCSFLRRCPPVDGHLVDVGCGSGVGGLLLAPAAGRVTLCDINDRARRYAEVNRALAGLDAHIVHSDVLADVAGPIDAVIANPPYMRDALGRAYRDGGGEWGEGLGVRIVREALARLAPHGRLFLYTGSAIIDGVDSFFTAVLPWLREAKAQFTYEEIDPDVFGEELEAVQYAGVDRIAAVGLCVQKA